MNRVVSEETILELVEDRVITSALLPFMRARKVYFKAEGLRPNSLYFPFLDGNNISAFTKGTTGPTGFQRYSDNDSDFGNTLTNLTEHPEGSNALVSDGNGIVSGSFIVPNNDTLRISTGTKEFKIMDISVDNEKDAAAVASTPYAGLGFLDTKEAEYTSTRQLNIQGQNVRRPSYSSDNSSDGGDGGGGPTFSGGEYNPNDPNTISGGWSDYKDDVYSDGVEHNYDGSTNIGGPTTAEESFANNTPGFDFT